MPLSRETSPSAPAMVTFTLAFLPFFTGLALALMTTASETSTVASSLEARKPSPGSSVAV